MVEERGGRRGGRYRLDTKRRQERFVKIRRIDVERGRARWIGVDRRTVGNSVAGGLVVDW